MYAYADASADGAASLVAAAKLVLYALLDDASVLVDVFDAARKWKRAGAATGAADVTLDRAAFAAWQSDARHKNWLRAEAELDDDERDAPVGLEHTVRVAAVRVLAGQSAPKTASAALALLRSCHEALASPNAASVRDAVLDADGMLDAWPSLDEEDRRKEDAHADVRFLRSYPALLALSYRWDDVATSASSASTASAASAASSASTASGASDGCGLAENRHGFCVPDPATMLDMHVCKYLKAGRRSNDGGDVREFGNPAKLGHIVDWRRATCAVSTDYCERYEHYPTLNGNIDEGCTGAERSSRDFKGTSTLGCMLPLWDPISKAVCLARVKSGELPPRQCESVRQACAKGDERCRCVIPNYLDPLRKNYVMETGSTAPLSILATMRGTLLDAR
jgi:hypothetical protein